MKSYDPREYWDVVQWNIQIQAAQAGLGVPQEVKRQIQDPAHEHPDVVPEVDSKRPPLPGSQTDKESILETLRPFNPYEGEQCAKQLGETLNSFLQRLWPSTTTIADIGPWLWVANPHSTHRPTDQDVARFKQEGAKALAEHLSQKFELEKRYPYKDAGGITRMLKPDRDALEIYIKELAIRCGVTCGKWMLFPSVDKVDMMWTTVCKAVLDGRLGCSAKVATDDGDPNSKSRLICIYTTDFSNINDVKRILEQIKRLGLISNVQGKARPIYYKSDAYTYLDISSGNEYKLKASMYCSNDLVFGEQRMEL